MIAIKEAVMREKKKMTTTEALKIVLNDIKDWCDERNDEDNCTMNCPYYKNCLDDISYDLKVYFRDERDLTV